MMYMYGKCELARAEWQTTTVECIISFQVQLHKFKSRICRHNRVTENIMHLALKASQQMTDYIYIVYSRAEFAQNWQILCAEFGKISRRIPGALVLIAEPAVMNDLLTAEPELRRQIEMPRDNIDCCVQCLVNCVIIMLLCHHCMA